MSKYNKHLIIVGTARSGTSWLSEIIATQYRYRLLFEPDHEFRTLRGKLICDRFFLNEQQAGVDAIKYMRQVFANHVDCDWIGQVSNRKFKRHLWPFVPKRYIIKFVRANLSAVFMNAYFDIPVVHVLRNPYDVIHSQERVKFPWLYDLSKFAAQPILVSLVQAHFQYDITQWEQCTAIEKLALRWCLENVIPLEVLGGYKGRALVIRYEDLKNDIGLFYDLCNTFDLEPREDIERVYKRPSSKTHPKSTIAGASKELYGTLSQESVSEINTVLDVFKTKLYQKHHT